MEDYSHRQDLYQLVQFLTLSVRHSHGCMAAYMVLTLIVLHKYTHVKPAALPYLRVTAAAVLNKSVELDWN